MNRRIVTVALLIIWLLVGVYLLAGCATMIDDHKPAPKDWPLLTVRDNVVPGHEVIRRCSKYTPWWAWPPLACAEVYFASNECRIWRAYDATPEIIEHEYAHCNGHDHNGDSTLADAWRDYKLTVAARAIAK